jgi:hypothetical protein
MKTTIAVLMTFMIMSCVEPNINPKDRNPIIIDSTALTSEKIMGEVYHGLYKIKLDDTTTILIYRGVESCTMIQLK